MVRPPELVGVLSSQLVVLAAAPLVQPLMVSTGLSGAAAVGVWVTPPRV